MGANLAGFFFDQAKTIAANFNIKSFGPMNVSRSYRPVIGGDF